MLQAILFLLFPASLATANPPEQAPSLEVVLPESLEKLDPSVAALVEEHAGRVTQAPRNGSLHGRLGMVYEANLLWELARDCYALASALAPDEPLWKYRLSIATRQIGDIDGSLGLLRDVVQLMPGLASARHRLGQALLERGDLGGAETEFKRLVELVPEAPEGYLGLGEVYLHRSDYESAAEQLAMALRKDPSYAGAHYVLGLAYRGLGRLEEARVELSAGAGSKPRALPDPQSDEIASYSVHLTARLERAGRLLQQRRAEEAVAILEGCRSDYPRNLTVLNNLGVAYTRQGRLDEAYSVLELARGLDDRRFSTYINLSGWAMRSGELERAFELASAAVERGPDVSATHAARARALFRLARPAEAAESLQQAVDLDPRDPRLLFTLAGLYERLGESEKAADRWRFAADRWSEVPTGWIGLARTLASLGQFEDAVEALARARALAPGHPEVLQLERRLLEQSGGE